MHDTSLPDGADRRIPGGSPRLARNRVRSASWKTVRMVRRELCYVELKTGYGPGPTLGEGQRFQPLRASLRSFRRTGATMAPRRRKVRLS